MNERDCLQEEHAAGDRLKASRNADARMAWQHREDKAREQEEAVLALVKERNATARDSRLNGELVIRLRYKDGGVMGKRVETIEDLK